MKKLYSPKKGRVFSKFASKYYQLGRLDIFAKSWVFTKKIEVEGRHICKIQSFCKIWRGYLPIFLLFSKICCRAYLQKIRKVKSAKIMKVKSTKFWKSNQQKFWKSNQRKFWKSNLQKFWIIKSANSTSDYHSVNKCGLPGGKSAKDIKTELHCFHLL